jgi:putative PIN family toxin of toxin-antitoxin system
VIGVTADANIHISSLVFRGVPRQLIDAAEQGKFELAISDQLIAEIQRVLTLKFAWSEEAISEMILQLTGCTTLVHPTETLDAVPSDPDDNRVLECAVAANSRYIVTGDNDLLRLGSFRSIQIVRVADFLKLLPTL